MTQQMDDATFADLNRFLPSHIAMRLPETEAMREAIIYLSGLSAAVRSFLPRYLADDDAVLAAQHSFLKPGAFLFADVSGFTALSEKIQQRSGAEGAEVLTTIIIDYFSTMLEILAKSNGQLLKFAGDALLAFFPVTKQDPDSRKAAIQAVRTGLRMQSAMIGNFQPVSHVQLMAVLGPNHQSSLTMSIGIARGKLFEALVGSNQQRDHIIQGELPGLAMQAEGVGERDEVIIDNVLADVLRDEFVIVPFDDTFSRVMDVTGGKLDNYELTMPDRRRAKPTALFDLEQENLQASLVRQLKTVQIVSRYLAPKVLSELIHSDNFHLQSEHRLTVTMFIHATGFAEMLARDGDGSFERVTGLLNRYYNIVQRIIAESQGTLARTDPYKLGTKLLITFGAPLSHADDPERAVAAALSIMSQIDDFNERLNEELPPALRTDGAYIAQRIGITQGEIFAGEVGWKQRREFTVMGDDVNLAARLMAHAQPGQILISQRMQDQVADSFATEAIEPLILKGKRLPVQAYLVHATVGFAPISFDNDTPFVGHDMFMLSLKYALQQATRKRRRALALIGDAGMGKTRIAQQVARDAKESGFRVAWVTSVARNGPRTMWEMLLHQLLDIPGEQGSDPRQHLHERLLALGLGSLESVFSELLFGYAPLRHKQPKPRPEVLALPAARRDLFARIQAGELTTEEMKSSGMFGKLSRASSEKEQTSETGAALLYQQVGRYVNLDEALVRLFQRLSEEQPLLIVLDDVHTEAKETLTPLRHIIASITQARLVLLATYEPVNEFTLDMQPLIVPDLSEDETYQMAMATLHVSELDSALSQLLWTRSSGRPLFVESLLRLLHEDGFITVKNGRASLNADSDLGSIPSDVRTLVVSRIDHMSEDAKSIARVAAIFDEPIGVEELTAVGTTLDPVYIRQALAELIAARILQSVGDDQVVFQHGLTRSVIYETLSRAQRVKFHRAAARYYQHQVGQAGISAVLKLAKNAAYHLTRCGLLPQAVELIGQQEERAEAEQRDDIALELVAYALTLLPDDKSLASLHHTLEERVKALQE